MSTPTAKQLPSGSWRLQFRVNGERVSITRPTEREAVRDAMAMQAEVRIREAHPENETIGEIVDAYIAHRENANRASPATIRGYKTIRAYSFQKLMETPVGRCTRSLCQSAIDSDERNPKTVHNAWGLVHAAVRWRTGQDIHVELPQIERNDHPFLDSDQVMVFLQAVKGKPIEPCALLGLHSMRRSEIADTRWSDIDLDADVIHVHGAAVYNSDGQLVHKEQNKTAESRRDIPIMIERLRELRRDADPDKLVLSPCNPLYDDIILKGEELDSVRILGKAVYFMSEVR